MPRMPPPTLPDPRAPRDALLPLSRFGLACALACGFFAALALAGALAGTRWGALAVLLALACLGGLVADARDGRAGDGAGRC